MCGESHTLRTTISQTNCHSLSIYNIHYLAGGRSKVIVTDEYCYTPNNGETAQWLRIYSGAIKYYVRGAPPLVSEVLTLLKNLAKSGTPAYEKVYVQSKYQCKSNKSKCC